MRPTSPRRRGLTAVAVVALVALAACSGSSNESSADDEGGGADGAAVTEAGALFPVTVETPHGDVTVDEAPTEVVALSLDAIEAMLALGVEPTAAPDAYVVGPWVTEILGEGSEVFRADIDQSPSTYETLRLIGPDLMVGDAYVVDDERHPRLSDVAPTISWRDDAGDTTAGAWEEITRLLGEVLGQPDEAETVIEDTLALIAAARDGRATGEAPVITLAAPYGADEVIATTGTDHSGLRFLEALGFEVLSLEGQGEAFGGGRTSLSLENLDLLAGADVILLGTFDDGAVEALEQNPLYESIEDRVVALDPEITTAINTPTALNIPTLIEVLTPYLAGGDDG